jgi:hypothetical protein
MTTADLLSIWITETNGHDVDAYRPTEAQLQEWLDTYGETVARVGMREGTRGFVWKMGGVASPEQAYYMNNYINAVMRDRQATLARRAKRREKRKARVS